MVSNISVFHTVEKKFPSPEQLCPKHINQQFKACPVMWADYKQIYSFNITF